MRDLNAADKIVETSQETIRSLQTAYDCVIKII